MQCIWKFHASPIYNAPARLPTFCLAEKGFGHLYDVELRSAWQAPKKASAGPNFCHGQVSALVATPLVEDTDRHLPLSGAGGDGARAVLA